MLENLFIVKVCMIIHVLFDPFMNYGFMRRAIVACCALSISVTPIGGFLMLRRMSLVGDALSHAVLPGVAIVYFFSGVSLIAMSIGGFISGLIVAILSFWVSEKTCLREDASFSGFYISSLAIGVVLISLHEGESSTDLLNLLFGSVLSVSMYHLKCIGIVSSVTLLSLALFYRVLVIETFDSDFLKSNHIKFTKIIQIFFLSIVVLNLIASLQITGTLMSIGLMMLPSLSARYWVKNLMNMFLLSVLIALLCSWIGLLGAFYMSLSAGPSIILCSSVVFFISVLFGNNQGLLLFLYNR